MTDGPLPNDAAIRRVLRCYPSIANDVSIGTLTGGLINQTYAVGVDHILQRVHSIFPAQVHANIDAITRRAQSRGLTTLTLVPALDGSLYVGDHGSPRYGGLWRIMTRLPGETLHTIPSPKHARSAAKLVGQWHRALEGLVHSFVGMRSGVHDFARHRAALLNTLRTHHEHPAFDAVAELAGSLVTASQAIPQRNKLATILGHGDLKTSNILFSGHEATALIDLDTAGPIALDHELGDAWRSWCNTADEDDLEASFDLKIFAASVAGYYAGLGAVPEHSVRRELLYSVERISLELAMRFATDALLESYFGWKPEKFPSASAHNFVRARSQWTLHQRCIESRSARAQILDVSP